MDENNKENNDLQNDLNVNKKNIISNLNIDGNKVNQNGYNNINNNQNKVKDSKKNGKKSMINNNLKNISKGDLLEYRLKRLIFAMGYFPKRGILIKTSQEGLSDNITDLDVYGIYIHKNFTLKTIWADCKAGGAKPLERISWILGIKNIVKIDDVIFVKKGIRYKTRQFARKLGVQILDLEIIDRLEADFNIDSDDWRGSWNPSTQQNQLIIFERINVPNNDNFKKIANFMYSDYWILDNYTKVKKTITALKQLSGFQQIPLRFEEIKAVNWAIFELINLFVLAILDISKEIYYFSDKDKYETIRDGLISGEISVEKRKQIVDAAYKVAYSIVKRQNPTFNGNIGIQKIGLEPPEYFEALDDLILRITNSPLNYFDILRFLDFVFMEFDLQSRKIEESTLKIMFPNYDNLVISSKTIIHFICSVTGIQRDLFQFTKS